jgi:Spy/CpxP family protein refolding chaperone
MKLLLVPLLALALAAPVCAQTDTAVADQAMAKFRADLQKDRRTLITAALELTEEEAARFWPAYDAYETAMRGVTDQRVALIKRYADLYNAGPVADADAKRLLDDAMAIDKDEAKQRANHLKKIAKTLPAVKATRFYQVDNKITALVKLDVAALIPLIE